MFFTVTPKHGLPTDTQVQNQASVIFDVNPPIPTPTWTNTLDNTPPASHVVALPATEISTSFTIQWTGTDVGSGVQDFTIYVSDNGGPFAALLSNTPVTSATFTGQTGHVYGFHSIARDLVGGVEAAKSAAETATQVLADITPPVIVAHVTGTSGTDGWYVTSSSGCSPRALNSDTAGITVTCTATNGIGLIATAPMSLKIDKTRPSITGSRTPEPNASGWNNAGVTVSFQCSDSLSGLAPGSPPSPTVLSTEGVGQSVTRTCQDLAGNSSSSTVSNVNLDLTPPTVTVGVGLAALWPPNGKLVPDTISGTVIDKLSGIDPSTVAYKVIDEYGQIQPAGPITLAPNGRYSFRVMLEASRLGQDLNGRQYQIVVSAADKAGNRASASMTVTVPHDRGK